MLPEIDPNDLIQPKRYGETGPPHEVWTQLRKHSPVHRCEPDDYEHFWAITRHADIMDISGKPEIFSNLQGPILLTEQQLLDRQDREGGFAGMKTIIEMDPPQHRDFRKVASGFFTPRSIHRLDEIVARSAREQVDNLGEEGEADFVDVISQRHPLRVLATILGIDPEDEEKVLELTQQLFASEDPELQRAGEDRKQASEELGLEFYQLFDRIVQDRRAHPRDDLASMLANAKLADGSPMGPVETFGYYLIVFTAGHDTTRNAISGGMEAFLENPDQLKWLCRNPELTKRAVEEVIRWASPVNYMRRTMLRDVELRGEKLREGEHLVMFYASANRDDDVFERPFDFDINRHPNRHLAFGTGEHFCLGAHVARLSTRALFLELANRIEMMEPAGPARHIESSFVVGLKSLPIRYKIRPAA
ncbi:MAG: cytochrome P450 [Myxococcota bacterium]|nr:cytochrome P450 [Myxococcota bacterium]